MSVLGGNVKRSGPVLLHRRSGASHAAVRKAHVHTCIHWMRACMCVCEPIHVHLHAHITRYVHTVYTCVGIHTHTCAYTHTQTCTQDTNPKLWDARVQEKKRNHVTIVYTYIHIRVVSQSLHNTQISKKKNPAEQKTAQFFPFFFCFVRELNPHPLLTFSL